MPPLPPTLLHYLKERRLDAILITNLHNIRYLSGFTGTNGLILITKKKHFFFTDSRYTEQVKRQVSQVFQVPAKGGSASGVSQVLVTEIASLAKQLRLKRIGFEAGATTVADE